MLYEVITGQWHEFVRDENTDEVLVDILANHDLSVEHPTFYVFDNAYRGGDDIESKASFKDSPTCRFLRFKISPSGAVTEYIGTTKGEITHIKRYDKHAFRNNFV